MNPIQEEKISGLLSTLAVNGGCPWIDQRIRTLIYKGLSYLIDKPRFKGSMIAEMNPYESNATRFAIDDTEFMLTHANEHSFTRLKFKLSREGFPECIIQRDLQNCDVDESLLGNISGAIDDLHQDKKPVVAFFGGTRKAEPTHIAGVSDQACDYIVDEFGYVGVLTAGYRGSQDAVYGTTRAAYDSARQHKGQTLSMIITPEVGKLDCHQNPECIDYYGGQWGDDTPALIWAADAAIVFAPYGLITELEIATAIQQGKPVVIVDTSLPESQPHVVVTKADCGYIYQRPVDRFRTVQDAMKKLCSELQKNGFDKATTIDSSRGRFDKASEYPGSPVQYCRVNKKWRSNPAFPSDSRFSLSRLTRSFSNKMK